MLSVNIFTLLVTRRMWRCLTFISWRTGESLAFLISVDHGNSLASCSLRAMVSLHFVNGEVYHSTFATCGTHFGFGPLLVSIATNNKRFRILLYITHGNKMIVLSVPIYARYRLSGIFRQKTRLHQPRRSKFYLRLSCYYKI